MLDREGGRFTGPESQREGEEYETVYDFFIQRLTDAGDVRKPGRSAPNFRIGGGI